VSARALLGAAILLAILTACESPEASRARGGGPGADVGNHGRVADMHAGSWMFYRTPDKIGGRGPDLEPARQSQRLSRRTQ
jgi:hypothetical protein